MMCPELDQSIRALVNCYKSGWGSAEPQAPQYPRPSELLPLPIEWDPLKIEGI